MNNEFIYQGKELELFEQAHNWKSYLLSRISQYLKGDVLEVGAGIGSATRAFNAGTAVTWTMLEPDARQCQYLQAIRNQFPSNIAIVCGDLAVVARKKFDVILYIDVLEHIENDRQELKNAAALLNEKGVLIVLSPAFQFLFSEFDQSIGHYRRYAASELKQLTPPDLELLQLEYLDSLGFFASFMNKYLLRQSYPTVSQLRFWDRTLIPVSRLADRVTGHTFGKSILAVWEKNGHAAT
ncbi:MAG TPA: class I SAM-dependent methyltransferase [Flavisolibacter sp.]|nr:class I SAM-dependent methyltransferase [Flavisolibacter sp.]